MRKSHLSSPRPHCPQCPQSCFCTFGKFTRLYEPTIGHTMEGVPQHNLAAAEYPSCCHMKKQGRPRVSYLRNHRLVWGLTERELSRLIGLRDSSQVCRIERSKRAPKTEIALACQVIFGIP